MHTIPSFSDCVSKHGCMPRSDKPTHIAWVTCHRHIVATGINTSSDGCCDLPSLHAERAAIQQCFKEG